MKESKNSLSITSDAFNSVLVGGKIGATVGPIVGALARESVRTTVGEMIGALVVAFARELVGALVRTTVGEMIGALVAALARESVGSMIGALFGAMIGRYDWFDVPTIPMSWSLLITSDTLSGTFVGETMDGATWPMIARWSPPSVPYKPVTLRYTLLRRIRFSTHHDALSFRYQPHCWLKM